MNKTGTVQFRKQTAKWGLTVGIKIINGVEKVNEEV